MHKLMVLAAVAAAWAALADGEENELVQEGRRNPWHLTIGPVMAPRVRTSIRGPRMTLPAIPANGSTRFGTSGNALPADPSAGYVERVYVDGHVKPDEGTEDTKSTKVAGKTWDWSAADVSSQYSAGQMEFHTDMTRWTESYSSSSYMGGGSEHDRDILLGVEAMGGWTFWEDRAFEASVDLGFRYYGSDDQCANSRCGTSVTTFRNEYCYVDRYEATGWKTFPEGRYVGKPNGGRLLGAQPTREEELMRSSTSYSSYSYANKTKLDYDIWDLRLGPTFGWKVTDWFALRGGVYGLIGLVNAELKTDTASSRGSSHASSSKCTPVFGMAFALTAQANLTDNLFLYGGIEYDWWTDKVSMDAGGSHATLQLSDYSVSAGVGFEF